MIFRKLLGHQNSIILEYDHFTDSEFTRFQTEVEEVRSFYKVSKISELVKGVFKKKDLGRAAILFKNPRKSVMLKAVPYCLERELPFNVSLRVDCIGLNRLPEDEEVEIYRTHYPAEMRSRTFSESEEVYNQELIALRKEVGPLPINQLDPTQFFCTWGKLIELPGSLFEPVLTLHSEDLSVLGDGINIMRQQLGQSPLVGKNRRNRNYSEAEGQKIMTQLGLNACVGDATGAVSPNLRVSDLPVWHFST